MIVFFFMIRLNEEEYVASSHLNVERFYYKQVKLKSQLSPYNYGVSLMLNKLLMEMEKRRSVILVIKFPVMSPLYTCP